MKEEERPTQVTNHFEAGSNCQVFNGNISGSVFAMPGATVNQYVAPPSPQPTDATKGKDERIQALLRREIEAAKTADKSAKHLLLPYRAAIEAGAISDTMSCEDFNARYGCTIAKSSFGEWVRSKNYEPREIEPLTEQFRAIVNA